jgi:hypothetical protein
MAVADLCLNGDKKWFATAYRIDVCYAGCVKNAQWVIKWYRESLPSDIEQVKNEKKSFTFR